MKNKRTEVVLLTKSYNLQDFKDWLHWHLDIVGFDHCHIFDNESIVDIKSVCDQYKDRVSYELVKGWPNQYALYNRYINNESRAWWVLPIDDDEYLWMRDFSNVNDLILFYQSKWNDISKLSIRWQNMFPVDPSAERGTKSLMEFNTVQNEKWADLFDGGNKPVKTFVKTDRPTIWNVTYNTTHNPTNGSLSYMCNGDRISGNWYFGKGDDAIKILHFQYKSKKEWIVKCNRNIDAGVKERGHYDKKYEKNWELMK